jgi:hypothetical protein
VTGIPTVAISPRAMRLILRQGVMLVAAIGLLATHAPARRGRGFADVDSGTTRASR